LNEKLKTNLRFSIIQQNRHNNEEHNQQQFNTKKIIQKKTPKEFSSIEHN
jgi:hypothetical protein